MFVNRTPEAPAFAGTFLYGDTSYALDEGGTGFVAAGLYSVPSSAFWGGTGGVIWVYEYEWYNNFSEEHLLQTSSRGDRYGIACQISKDGTTFVMGADQGFNGGPGYVETYLLQFV